ncbi:unnamed protein product [Clavelina lepadiformis]|uniref:Uncharacterized protein n=1 Tax=Clavelina lepadiformis TaxID=159417 RepID=A0ABP0GY75_CLALP
MQNTSINPHIVLQVHLHSRFLYKVSVIACHCRTMIQQQANFLKTGKVANAANFISKLHTNAFVTEHMVRRRNTSPHCSLERNELRTFLDDIAMFCAQYQNVFQGLSTLHQEECGCFIRPMAKVLGQRIDFVSGKSKSGSGLSLMLSAHIFL